MADRYWVGGTDIWNATKGTKWALTSGGAGGEGIPTSSDDVYIDSYTSSSDTVTIGVSNACSNLNCTGFAGTIDTSHTVYVSGNLVLGSSTNWTGYDNIQLVGTAGPYNITCNGSYHRGALLIINGGSYIFTDPFLSREGIILDTGSLDMNSQAPSYMQYMNISGTNTRSLTKSGWGLFLTGTGTVWDATDTTNLTFSCSGTIYFEKSTTLARTFIGGGLTYSGINDDIAGTGTITFKGSNTFNSLALNQNRVYKFEHGTTTSTTYGIQTNGNATIESDSAGVPFTISRSDPSPNVAAFTMVKDCIGSPADEWYANASADGTGNTDWTFTTISGTDAYWVGGTAGWGDSRTWAFYSGGPAIQSVPDSYNLLDVYFDVNSGSGTCSGSRQDCRKFDLTGFTGTLSINTMRIYGDLILDSLCTISIPFLTMFGNSGTQYIHTNGVILSYPNIYINNHSGCVAKLADDCLSGIEFDGGIFDTDGFNITADSGSYFTVAAGGGTIYLRDSVITMTGHGAAIDFRQQGTTLDAGTSLIKVTGATAGFDIYVHFDCYGSNPGGYTLYDLEINYAGSNPIHLQANNTAFNNIFINTTKTIYFRDNSNVTITTFSGPNSTLKSETSGTPFTLTKSGGGVITDTFTLIKDSIGAPAATWYAPVLADGGGNSGWTFGGSSVIIEPEDNNMMMAF